jgi:hypothetical protein
MDASSAPREPAIEAAPAGSMTTMGSLPPLPHHGGGHGAADLAAGGATAAAAAAAGPDATTVAAGSPTAAAATTAGVAAPRVTPLKKLTVFLIKTYREVNEVCIDDVICSFFLFVSFDPLLLLLLLFNMLSTQRYYERKARKKREAEEAAKKSAPKQKFNNGWDDENCMFGFSFPRVCFLLLSCFSIPCAPSWGGGHWRHPFNVIDIVIV